MLAVCTYLNHMCLYVHVHNSGSQSSGNRKVVKSKSTRANVDLDSNSKFQRCTPLTSSSSATPSNHSSSSSSSSSTDAGSVFSPPHFAPGHTLHSLNSHSPMSYCSANANSTLPSDNATYVSDINGGHVNWPLIDADTRVSHPHSPIASLAPHSTHTLPFTTLNSRGNNEDITVNDNSSLPYYYPPEWNRDVPEWNRVDPPEWSRADFMDNPVGTMPPSYSMGATNHSQGPSPSLLSSWEEPLDVDLGGNSQANDIRTVPTLTSSASVTTSANDRTTSNTSDPQLFGAIPTSNGTGDIRMTQSRRESIGQHRRRGVSYSSDEHESILQELLSPQPATSTPYSSFSPRPYGPLSSNRFRLGQSSRFTPDVLSDDYTTRRRSARVTPPGRSRLDALQHRPVDYDLASTSSTLLESDNSPVLPLEDIAGILSDIERNDSLRPPQELPSDSRGHVATEELSPPTTNTAGISPISISASRSDVITISSDDEVSCVCLYVSVSVCMYACTPIWAHACMYCTFAIVHVYIHRLCICVLHYFYISSRSWFKL